jgi:hypothetical protein|tara:strand:- start:62 stop:502 length:441 start_codon:yes stop_codon:yes gene_type:complete
MERSTVDKHRIFAYHYAITGNSTQSVVKAGYSPNSAAKQAYRLLKDQRVRNMIAESQKEFAKSLNGMATAELSELTADAMEVRVRLTEMARNGQTPQLKLGALKLLAQSHNLLGERHILEQSAAKEEAKITAIEYRESPSVVPQEQ